MEPEPEPEPDGRNIQYTPIILPLPLSISQLMNNMAIGPLFTDMGIGNFTSLEERLQH